MGLLANTKKKIEEEAREKQLRALSDAGMGVALEQTGRTVTRQGSKMSEDDLRRMNAPSGEVKG